MLCGMTAGPALGSRQAAPQRPASGASPSPRPALRAFAHPRATPTATVTAQELNATPATHPPHSGRPPAEPEPFLVRPCNLPAVWLCLLAPLLARPAHLNTRCHKLLQTYEIVRGALVRYSSAGGRPPPTAVLVHGILGKRQNMLSFARRLVEGFPHWQVSVYRCCWGPGYASEAGWLVGWRSWQQFASWRHLCKQR